MKGSEEDESDDDDDDELEDIDNAKIGHCSSIKSVLNFNKDVFTPVILDDLKLKETTMMERNTSGYYRCKVRHATLYEEMSQIYDHFIKQDML